jgi:hypothetical protein
MRKQLQRWLWLLGVLVVIGSVIGCSLFNADQESPTAPAGGANYAQLPDEPGCSAVLNFDGAQHQFNLFVTPFTIPFGSLLYVELNEQLGVGKLPGVDQIDGVYRLDEESECNRSGIAWDGRFRRAVS